MIDANRALAAPSWPMRAMSACMVRVTRRHARRWPTARDALARYCSASDSPEHDSIDVVRRWHVDGNGWDDVGYHYFIRRDGTLETGRPLERTPAAQAGNNAATIAICVPRGKWE